MTVTRLKFGLPGYFLGLIVGVGLNFLSNTIFSAGLIAMGIIGFVIVLRRNQKAPKNWHMVAGGFVFGYGSIYSLQICLTPFMQ